MPAGQVVRDLTLYHQSGAKKGKKISLEQQAIVVSKFLGIVVQTIIVSRFIAITDLLQAVLIWDGAPLTRRMMIVYRRALPGEKQSPSLRTMPIPDGTVLPGEKRLMTILGHPNRLLEDSLHSVQETGASH